MPHPASFPATFTSPPTAERPAGPPPRRNTLGEWRTLREPPRLLRASPRLLRAPRGDGRLVLDIPGYLAPEATMAPLRLFLRAKGHDARPWGLGTNQGRPERAYRELLERLEPLVEASGRPASLVAWSLGGVIAREAARQRPDLIHRVVTFGSPLIGGPTHTVTAKRVGEAQCLRIAEQQEQLDREQPLQVPITTIFSRRDGVVNWRACLDHYSSDATHVEVSATHTGLVLDPDVWLTVARVLASRD